MYDENQRKNEYNELLNGEEEIKNELNKRWRSRKRI